MIKFRAKILKNKLNKNWIQSWDSVEISAKDKDIDFSLHLTMYAKNISWEIINILENTIFQKQDWLKNK